jgi:hypothetical protein
LAALLEFFLITQSEAGPDVRSATFPTISAFVSIVVTLFGLGLSWWMLVQFRLLPISKRQFVVMTSLCREALGDGDDRQRDNFFKTS